MQESPAFASTGATDEEGTCDPSWIPTFGALSGPDRPVEALAIFDDGTGPALYAAGRFTSVAGIPRNHIAKWEGSKWADVGTGVDGVIHSLIVFDDGNGEALYAGGSFGSAGGIQVQGIAKWDGTAWSSPGSGLFTSNIRILTFEIFDDGTGKALYAGGMFKDIDGVAANNIAKWDGSNWTPLGSGLDTVGSTVNDLTTFDMGNGEQLYAGGRFQTADGQPVNNIAKWDGSNWSPLGSGVNDDVFAITGFDDGNSASLYVGGRITMAGQTVSPHGTVPIGQHLTLASVLLNRTQVPSMY